MDGVWGTGRERQLGFAGKAPKSSVWDAVNILARQGADPVKMKKVVTRNPSETSWLDGQFQGHRNARSQTQLLRLCRRINRVLSQGGKSGEVMLGLGCGPKQKSQQKSREQRWAVVGDGGWRWDHMAEGKRGEGFQSKE